LNRSVNTSEKNNPVNKNFAATEKPHDTREHLNELLFKVNE